MDIQEIQLLTDDPVETRRFYNDLLGLRIISSDVTITSFSAGSSVLAFHKSENKKPVYHFAFNIPINKFYEALQWISERLPLIEISTGNYVADFNSWNAKAFYFFDNNRNIVEMIARFDLDNGSANLFSGGSICSISEIGLVVEDPIAYAQQLLTNHQVKLFSKQQPMEHFIAMGDDDGLFIIVTENRKWYPTIIRSARHWSKVTIWVAGGHMEITT